MKRGLRAFTIAEIAVALSVIAFVVMVTIPVSRKKFEKVTYLQYYKAYELVKDMSGRLNNYSICNQTFFDLTGKCIKAVPLDVLYDPTTLYNSDNLSESLGYSVEKLDVNAVAMHYCKNLNPDSYRLVNSNELKEIINYVYYGVTDLQDWSDYWNNVQTPNDNYQSVFFKSEPITETTGSGYYYIKFLSGAYPGLNNMAAFYSMPANSRAIFYDVPNTTDYSNHRLLTIGWSRLSNKIGISSITLNNATQTQETFDGEQYSYTSGTVSKLRNSDLRRQVITGDETTITTKKAYKLAVGTDGYVDRLRIMTDRPTGNLPACNVVNSDNNVTGTESYYTYGGHPLSLYSGGNQTAFMTPNPQKYSSNNFNSYLSMIEMLNDWDGSVNEQEDTTRSCYAFLDTDSPHITDTDDDSTFGKYRMYKIFRMQSLRHWAGSQNMYSSAHSVYYSDCNVNQFRQDLGWDSGQPDQYCVDAAYLGGSVHSYPLYNITQKGLIHSFKDIIKLTNGTTTPQIESKPFAFCRFESLDR